MDNGTLTSCEICRALIMYDKDAKKPELCYDCKNQLVDQDDDNENMLLPNDDN